MSKYREPFFELINNCFESRSFKFIKSKDSFERKNGDMKFLIKFYFHSRSVETAIEVKILISHIPTERIYKKATGFSIVSTIGNEVGKLINNPSGVIVNHESFDIILNSMEDLNYAKEKVEFILNEIAEPYFINYGNLDSIDSILNDNPEVISVHRNDQYNRYPIGLIVAALNGRMNYEALEEDYNKLILEMSEMYIDRYNLVKEYLKKNKYA